MKRSAFFINIGRGMTTRLDALDAALRSGTIAGAGIDVYEIEPAARDHPLWTAPNAVLTPHVADRGPDLDPARVAVIAENARRSPPASLCSTSWTRPTGSDLARPSC